MQIRSWSGRRKGWPVAAVRLGLLAALVLVLAGGGASGAPVRPGPGETREVFAPVDQPPRNPADRLYRLRHVRLDLAFDLHRHTVEGTATNVVTPRLSGLDHLVFHAAGLRVARVRLAATPVDLAFATDAAAQTLTVRLPRAYTPQETLEVAIEYSAQPRAGLFFTGPDQAYPQRPWQMFSDGEPDLNRFWFPSWDEPDERATSELLATVDRPLEVIGNGRLLDVQDRPGARRTFHWSMEQPHSTYLTSVVIGEFSHSRDSWHGVPIDSAVPPALAARAARAFGHTADMMDFFSHVTAVAYPFPRYSQVTVYGFTWGGLENITATAETVDTLRDERAELDGNSDDLVSHELAHQWFGDLVTCRSWEHTWLNEGMASYFEALYLQHRSGATGDDELAWKLDTARQNYFEEDREHYRRPLATNRYADPGRMFDSHTYDKGALVVHMLHELAGEEGWWQGIKTYLERHALGTVTSHDLEAALEDASGVSLKAFFDQFVYGAGYPELKITWNYQAAAELVRLDVRQTQRQDGSTGLFSFPVEVALIGDGEPAGPPRVQRVQLLARPRQDLYLRSPTRPRTVVFDPRGALLKSLDFDKPVSEWIAQLGAALPLAAHLDAARALAEQSGGEAVEVLGDALLRHRFRGLREVAAAGLQRIGTEPALKALERATKDPDSHVRSVVLAAFGSFADHPELIAPLRRALEGDPSYRVRAAAAAALGRFQDNRSEVTPLLLRALAQPSFLEQVPRAAIKALADLGAPETLPHALRLARYGSPPAGRAGAMLALARFAAQSPDPAHRRQARRTLEAYLNDPDPTVRQKVPEALADLGDPEAIPALQRSLQAEILDEQRHPRELALNRLRQAAEPTPSTSLEERVRRLERANEVLQEQLRELQERGDPAGPTLRPPRGMEE